MTKFTLTTEQKLYAQMRFSQVALKIEQDYKDIRHTMKVHGRVDPDWDIHEVDFEQGENQTLEYPTKQSIGWLWSDITDITFKLYPDRRYNLRINVLNTEHKNAILPLDVDLVSWKYNEDNCDMCDWHDAFPVYQGNSVSDRYAELSTGKGPISPETTMTLYFEGTTTCFANQVRFNGPEGKVIDGLQWLGMTFQERRNYRMESEDIIRYQAQIEEDHFDIEECTMQSYDNPNHCTDGLSRVIDAVNASRCQQP